MPDSRRMLTTWCRIGSAVMHRRCDDHDYARYCICTDPRHGKRHGSEASHA